MTASLSAPVRWRVRQASQFVETMSDEQELFIFVGKHSAEANSGAVDLHDDTLDVVTGAYRNMIMGTKVTANGLTLMYPTVPYASQYFDRYDDGDPELFSKQFYATIHEGSFYHTWKVLDNNDGANSSVGPVFADVNGTNDAYRTSDGYLWKYLFSVDTGTYTSFATSLWAPLTANAAVATLAIDGGIDVIAVDEAGSGYHNYLTGAMALGDIRVNGNSTLYAVANARSTNGFYTGCRLYLSTGIGSGQSARVIDYFSNPNGNFVVLNEAFTISPQNGTEYELYPEVLVTAQGGQTTNVVAIAVINSVGNAVYRCEILERGSGVTFAVANVIANATVGVLHAATVRPIMPPPGGHGANAAVEIGAFGVAVSSSISNNAGNTVPATNRFQQVGLITDPEWMDVKTFFSSAKDTFLADEPVRVANAILVATGLTTVVDTNTVNAGTELTLKLSAGDNVLLATAEEDAHQLATVASVTNSSQFILTSDMSFSCTAVRVSAVSLTTSAVVKSVLGPNTIILDHATKSIHQNDLVVGTRTGATGIVDHLSRGGVVKGFNTFVGMDLFIANTLVGAFQQNETVTGPNSSAALHSATSNGGNRWMYVSNAVGPWTPSTTITGSNSGATAIVQTKYGPEIKHGSGEILYLENTTAANVTASNTLHFEVILTF